MMGSSLQKGSTKICDLKICDAMERREKRAAREKKMAKLKDFERAEASFHLYSSIARYANGVVALRQRFELCLVQYCLKITLFAECKKLTSSLIVQGFIT